MGVPYERLKYEPRFHYNGKVLIGKHWYEEQQKYIFSKYKHCTTNITHFPDKGPYEVDPREYWKNKISSEKGKFREITDENVQNNFVTTYKISFDILPKTKGFQKRKYSRQVHTYVPQQNYNQEYGNIHYGINDEKQAEIQDERSKYAWISETHTDFLKPSAKSYTTKRRAIPRVFSSALCPANLQNIDLPFRDLQISIVPDYLPAFKHRRYPHFYF